MGRPKKVVPPPPPQALANPNAAQDYLAKARALVAQTKRKNDTDVTADEPVRVKAKPVVTPEPSSSPPKACAMPSVRVRGKSPGRISASPPAKAPPVASRTVTSGKASPAVPPKPAAPAKAPPAAPPTGAVTTEASSAFDRVKDVLQKAKDKRVSLEAACAKPAAPAVAANAPQIPPKAAPGLSIKPPPQKAVSRESLQSSLAETPKAPSKACTEPKAPSKDTSSPMELDTPPVKAPAVPPTPPNTASTSATSLVTSPVAPKKLWGETEEEPWYNSQRDYFGSRGESWWGNWDSYGGPTWYYDSWKNRDVYCWGPESWVVDRQSTWDYGSGDATTPVPSPAGTEEAPGDVRSTLANRMPSRLSVTTSSEAAETPDGDGADEADPGEAEPAEDGENGTGDKWRLDKRGNPLSPAALYMRFYRNIRSIMAKKSKPHFTEFQ